MGATLSVRVATREQAARDVVQLELRAEGGALLPAFTAGAHVDLHLAADCVRSYSLLNDPAERDRYVIAVHRSPRGKGGSQRVHDTVQAEDTVRITEPRNHFALDEAAPHSVLVAGGIGITPLHAMVRRLEALGRSWELHYCARTREHAALREQLAMHGNRVRFHFDDEQGGRLLDLAALVAAAPAGAHFYCCGPTPMLQAFERATATLPPERVHREYFSAPAAPALPDAASQRFVVELARTGGSFVVEPGESILDKLIEHGHDIEHSCCEGVCGSCETAVLSGTPDHRDLVLAPAERAAGRTMMVCCSRASSERLVLDL